MASREELKQIVTSVKNERNKVDHVYQEAYRMCLPLAADWCVDKRDTTGPNRLGHLYTTAGTQGIRRFGAFITGTTTPATGNWYRLEDSNPEINKDEDSREWYATATRMLGEAIKKTFYQAATRAWTEMGASYGVLYSYAREVGPEKALTGEVIFEHVPSSDFYFIKDHTGRLHYGVRRIRYNLAQAEGRFDRVPSKWREEGERDPSKLFNCWHIVRREKEDEEAGDFEDDFQFQGYYLAENIDDENAVLGRQGFRTMPYHVTGWDQIPASSYFVGPAYSILPELLGANATRRALVLLQDWLSRPPILAPEKNQIPRGFKLKPGTIVHGGVSENGARYQPMNLGANAANLFSQLADEEQRVRDGFYMNDMVTQARPNMTAYEVGQRVQEQAYSLAPFTILMVREVKEMLERAVAIMIRAGVLPPPPPIVAQAGDLQAQLIGPLAMAAKRAEVGNMIEAVGMVGSIAALDPTGQTAQAIRGPAMADEIFRAQGVNPSLTLSEREISEQAQQEVAQQAQAQQAQAALELPQAAERAANARKLDAQADAIAAGGPAT